MDISEGKPFSFPTLQLQCCGCCRCDINFVIQERIFRYILIFICNKRYITSYYTSFGSLSPLSFPTLQLQRCGCCRCDIHIVIQERIFKVRFISSRYIIIFIAISGTLVPIKLFLVPCLPFLSRPSNYNAVTLVVAVIYIL